MGGEGRKREGKGGKEKRTSDRSPICRYKLAAAEYLNLLKFNYVFT